jgi:exosome complex component RRP43
VVTTADASALVKVGASTALAGIKCEVMAPPDDRPGEGAATVTVELAPLCGPSARPGRPSEPAAVLTAQLAALLATPGVLDLGQLCIDPGKAAWAVYLDIVVLDDDGALHDVCAAAAVAALSTLRLPAVSVDAAGNVQPAEGAGAAAAEPAAGAPRAAFSLRLGRAPASLTCALHPGGQLIVDPTAEEEALAGAVVVTTVDADGAVLGMSKPGGSVAASPAQLRQCYEAAAARGRQVAAALAAAAAAGREQHPQQA